MERNAVPVRTGFAAAAALLPPELRRAALDLGEAEQDAAEEFRLRGGRRPTVLLPGGEAPLPGCAPVTAQVRATLPVFCGISGSISTTDILLLPFILAFWSDMAL